MADARTYPTRPFLAVSAAILRDGKTPVARTQNPIDSPNGIGGSVIGPVPLAGYEAGKYVVQLKVSDKLSKKDVTQETPLEIIP